MSVPALPQRVALFVPTLGYGGVERVILHLAQGLSQQGFSVDLVAAHAQGEFRDRVPAGIRVVDLRARRVLTSLPALIRYLRQAQPDAVIAAMTHSSAIALLARALSRSRTRVIATEHANLTHIVSHSRRARVGAMPMVVRWLYPRADAVVAVSRSVAEDTERLMRRPGGSVRVIYNPVITPELFARSQVPLDDEWFHPGVPPVIIGVGRLEAEKDFATLLRAFAAVRRQKAVRLLILGEGSQRASLQDLIRSLGIGADVRMPGFAANAYPYMRYGAALALTSRWEGFGLVLVEALALGTPVVSTDCPGGPAEILGGGKYGALVPVGDHEAFAAALARVLDARPAPAPQQWLDNFTVPCAARQYAELIAGQSRHSSEVTARL